MKKVITLDGKKYTVIKTGEAFFVKTRVYGKKNHNIMGFHWIYLNFYDDRYIQCLKKFRAGENDR